MATEEEIQDSIEEEVDQPQQTAMDALQLPLVPNALLSNQRMDNNSPLLANGLITHFPYHFPPPFLNCQHFQHQQRLMQQDRQFQMFWANQLQEMKASTDFRSHNLPLARIKKIMKADEDVKMIAAETLELFSRACEMFILELTHRSWSQVEHNKRRTLQRSDISSAIAKHQMFDFLIDIVPMEEVRDERVLTIPENEELNESIRSFYDPSRFGSFMVDMRRPEMVPHGLSFTQQQQDHNASEKDGTNSTENDSK